MDIPKIKFFKNFFVLLFLCSFQNCQEKSDLMFIHGDTTFENFNLSELGTKSSFVKLQTDIPLGEPSHVLCSNNFIYLIDQNHSGQLIKFDRDGKLLQRQNLSGDQKFKTNGLTSVFLENEMIRIVVNGNKILKFDLNLNIYDTRYTTYKAGYFFVIGNEFLGFNNHLENSIQSHIYWIDSTGENYSKTSLPINKNFYPYVYKLEYPFNYVEGELMFSKAFNDTIYAMQEDGKFKPKYLIDFGSKKIPSDFLSEIENGTQFYQKMREDINYSIYGGIHSTKKGHVITSAFHQLFTYPLVIDLNTNESKLVDKFVDDLNSGIKVRHVLFSDEELLVFGISGENLSLQLENVSEVIRKSLSKNYENDYYLIVVEK